MDGMDGRDSFETPLYTHSRRSFNRRHPIPPPLRVARFSPLLTAANAKLHNTLHVLVIDFDFLLFTSLGQHALNVGST